MKTLEEQFISACSKNDITLVKNYLNKMELNIQHNDNMAFKNACINNNVDIVNLLLNIDDERKIQFDQDIYWVVYSSCVNGYLDILQSLFNEKGERKIQFDKEQMGIKNLNSVFCEACQYNQLDIVEYLLSLKDERKIDTHHSNQLAFTNSYKSNHYEITKRLLKCNGKQKIELKVISNHILGYLRKHNQLKMIKIILENSDTNHFLSA